MAGEAVRGLASTVSMLDALPVAAKHELADLLGKIGRDVLADQRAHTPSDTGNLRAGLSLQLLTNQLKVRVGLLGVAATSKSAQRRAQQAGGGDPRNLGDIYYGRFVEFGRSAQKVVVTRRRAGAPKVLRNGRKRLEDLIKPYVLTVKPMAPRPFVELPDADLDQAVDGRLAAFWDKTLDDAGGGE